MERNVRQFDVVSSIESVGLSSSTKWELGTKGRELFAGGRGLPISPTIKGTPCLIITSVTHTSHSTQQRTIRWSLVVLRDVLTAIAAAMSAEAEQEGAVGGPDYDFFRRLGSPTRIVAPMVDHSDLPFRMQTRRHGAQLVFTQMLNSNVLLQSRDYRAEMLASCVGDRPLVVQICGDDPAVMLRAARLLEGSCDAIDINLGCPQGIARRGHYGAFLMEELDLLTDIVSTLVRGLRVPVTCKTRIYKGDFERSIRLCETLVAAGASMLTIHGRCRDEKGHEIGDADWDMIRRIKAHFAARGVRVPVIANGSISCEADVLRCLSETGVDGVMSSEAVLENPALFAQPSSQLDLCQEYLDLCGAHSPGSMRVVRSHVMKMLHRFFVVHEDLRDLAATARSIPDFLRLVALVRLAVRDEDDYRVTWYRRHMRAPTHAHSGRVAPEVARSFRERQLASSLLAGSEDILGGLFE